MKDPNTEQPDRAVAQVGLRAVIKSSLQCWQQPVRQVVRQAATPYSYASLALGANALICRWSGWRLAR
jgi:hypothetical protein